MGSKAYGSEVTRLGPLCVKRYRPHKRLPHLPPSLRLRHEVVGAGLLSSRHVRVARPLFWSERGAWAVRRWYEGAHPSSEGDVRASELEAVLNWLREHRGRGRSFPLRAHAGVAVLSHLSMRGVRSSDDPLAAAVLGGEDLLHGDLVAENVLLGAGKPVILDTESVCVGSIAWDAAQVVAFILRARASDPVASTFLDDIGLDETEKGLARTLVELFTGGGAGTCT